MLATFRAECQRPRRRTGENITDRAPSGLCDEAQPRLLARVKVAVMKRDDAVMQRDVAVMQRDIAVMQRDVCGDVA